MTKNDRLKRDLKENMINQAVLNHWWGLVQSVETLRANPGDTVAAFELGTIIHEGPDPAREALGSKTPVFAGMEFPAADKVFELMSNLMIGPSTKPEQE